MPSRGKKTKKQNYDDSHETQINNIVDLTLEERG
jgi:hypothetical protein